MSAKFRTKNDEVLMSYLVHEKLSEIRNPSKILQNEYTYLNLDKELDPGGSKRFIIDVEIKKFENLKKWEGVDHLRLCTLRYMAMKMKCHLPWDRSYSSGKGPCDFPGSFEIFKVRTRKKEVFFPVAERPGLGL